MMMRMLVDAELWAKFGAMVDDERVMRAAIEQSLGLSVPPLTRLDNGGWGVTLNYLPGLADGAAVTISIEPDGFQAELP